MNRTPRLPSKPLWPLLAALLVSQACGTQDATLTRPHLARTAAPLSLVTDTGLRIEAQHAVYPAPELQVFQIREGAFFGTLFGARAVSPRGVKEVHSTVPVLEDGTLNYSRVPRMTRGSLFPQMYACWDTGWLEEVSLPYMLHRLCTLEGHHNCAATPVGPCNPDVENRVCGTDSGPSGLGHFGECAVGERTWLYPMTTYLNAPCDVFINDPAGPGLCLQG